MIAFIVKFMCRFSSLFHTKPSLIVSFLNLSPKCLIAKCIKDIINNVSPYN